MFGTFPSSPGRCDQPPQTHFRHASQAFAKKCIKQSRDPGNDVTVAKVATAIRRPQSAISRSAYTALGMFFTGMGIIGMFVPVWPTTIFLILAVCCFKRGSERLERWLLEHPRFGPTLMDWQETGGMRMRTKWYALVALWISLGASSFFMKRPATVIILAVVAVAVSAYIWTRPTLPPREVETA